MPQPKLHEFMAENRDELLASCIEKMKRVSPTLSRSDVESDYATILDEMIAALQREDGLAATSPLPGTSGAAMEHGRHRQARGDSVSILATDVGAISDAVGQLAAERALSFTGREYRVFNQCVDTAIASALEQFWQQSLQDTKNREAERIGFLAHELRNSLSSARMAFDILKEGRFGVSSRTGDVLERSLARLDNLITQALLDVQLRGGKRPRIETLSVSDILRAIVEAAVPERGIQIAVEAEPSLQVHADDKLLVSAIGNLLQNALKFTRASGRIVLRGYRRNGAVFFEVEDECGGLPPGAEEDMFTPFVQKSSDRRGLGLGLAITREAIEAHGGHLTVRNRPGKGCIFIACLPDAAPAS